MVQAEDFNSAVRSGLERAGTPRQARITVGTTAAVITSDNVPIIWVIIQNLSANFIFIGGSTVTGNASATDGLRVGPNGNSVPLPFSNLNLIYLVANSGASNAVHYHAGSP